VAGFVVGSPFPLLGRHRPGREERHVRLARDRPGQQGLAGAGCACQQHAVRDLRAQPAVPAGIPQEVHDLPDLVLDVLNARDVAERGPLRRPGVVPAGAGPAHAAQPAQPGGPAAAHPPVEQGAEQQGGAEAEQELFPQQRALARRVGAHGDAVGLQLAEQVVVGPGGTLGGELQRQQYPQEPRPVRAAALPVPVPVPVVVGHALDPPRRSRRRLVTTPTPAPPGGLGVRRTAALLFRLGCWPVAIRGGLLASWDRVFCWRAPAVLLCSMTHPGLRLREKDAGLSRRRPPSGAPDAPTSHAPGLLPFVRPEQTGPSSSSRPELRRSNISQMIDRLGPGQSPVTAGQR